MILEKCLHNDNTVFKIEGNTWVLWYPMDSIVEDLDATNEVLSTLGFTLNKIAIKSNMSEVKIDHIQEEYLRFINDSLPTLKKRLDIITPPRIPEYALINEDDSHDW